MWRLSFFILLLLLATLYPFSIFWGYNIYFGVILAFYFLLQIGFSTKNYIFLKESPALVEFPSVSLLVVGHRENPFYWKNCLNSMKASKYPNITSICAFIDGNLDEDIYMKSIFDEIFPNQYACLTPQGGKRSVLYEGIQYIKEHFPLNEYIIVIDSDTVISPDGIKYLVNCIHQNPNNGCATGNIQIFNLSEGILAKIVHARYGYAFTIERSAMSAVGVMNCCSGPFSIYRQSYLSDNLLESFIQQRFCGHLVGPGDDRHLTLLMLKEGYLSRQTPFAIATTETPVTLHRYLQQQLRWMRSFYREMFWQISAIPKQHPYLSVITVYEILFPVFVILSFLPTFRLFPFDHQNYTLLFQRGLIALGILCLRTCLLIIFNKNIGILANLWNLCVFPLYFIFLLPLKIYALFTCPIQSWITSSRKKMVCSFNMDILGMYISIIIWWSSLLFILFRDFFISSAVNKPDNPFLLQK